MPGSDGSPNSELAMEYVHFGKSPPRPAATWPLRHSGAETIFLVSVMPSWMSALAMFTQVGAETNGTTMSAVVAPAAVSTPVRSVWVAAYGAILTVTPAAFRPASTACAPGTVDGSLGKITAAVLA